MHYELTVCPFGAPREVCLSWRLGILIYGAFTLTQTCHFIVVRPKDNTPQMSTINPPCINPNSDIAGIGIRISVFIQVFLNLLCALIFAKDGQISSYENTVLTATSINLFVTGCALILCAVVQAAKGGLGVYHALIVLNLSWIISLSAFLHIVIGLLNSFLALADLENGVPGIAEDDEFEASSTHAYVVPMSVFHLSAMGAFGIWFWATIDSFGDQPECTPATFSTIFGVDVPVTQNSFRCGSIILYSLVVVPFLNFIILAGAVVIGILLFAHCVCIPRRPGNRKAFVLIGGILVMVLLEVIFITDTELLMSRSSKLVKQGESDWSFGQTLALISLLLPFVETIHAGYKSLKEGYGVGADIRARRSRRMFPRLFRPLTKLVTRVVEPLAKRFGTNGSHNQIGPAPSTGAAIPMTGLGSFPRSHPPRPESAQPLHGSGAEDGTRIGSNRPTDT